MYQQHGLRLAVLQGGFHLLGGDGLSVACFQQVNAFPVGDGNLRPSAQHRGH